MKIEYDPKANAVYINILSDKWVTHTKELSDEINIDYTENNEIVGIEVLNIDKFSVEVL
jgi:uncharacterized protein YuzE